MVHPFDLRLLHDAGRRANALRDAALDTALERCIAWLFRRHRPATVAGASSCRS